MATPKNFAGLPNATAASLHRSDTVDPDAFSAIVRRNAGRMLAVCRRILGNEEDARDCVQDAFLSAFKNLARFEGRSTIASWLHRIVVNVAITRLRRRRWFREEPLEAASVRFDSEGCRIVDQAHSLRLAEAVFELHQRKSIVREAILDLPAGLRAALALRDIEGYSTAETADFLGITPAAVKVRLHRARLALKQKLEAMIEAGQP